MIAPVFFIGSSCSQLDIELIQQPGEVLSEKLMSFAEPASFYEGGEIKILLFHTQTRGDVVADKVEPGELVGAEFGASLGFVHEPFVEAFVDGFGEGL